MSTQVDLFTGVHDMHFTGNIANAVLAAVNQGNELINQLNKLIMQNLKPHKHREQIIAFANGHHIESRNSPNEPWELHTEECPPSWFSNVEYRIYDPLREVKEAFERGEVIELKRHSNSNWYEVYKGDDFGSDIRWLNRISEIHPEYEWRVKPKEEFKVGDWVINEFTKWAFRLTEEKIHKIKNSDTYLKSNGYKKATKQEVLNAPNYNGSATNEDFPFEKGDFIIDRSSNNNIIQLQGSIVSVNGKCFYATKKEIENSHPFKKQQPKEYIPFEWEDRDELRGKWVRSKSDPKIEVSIMSFDGTSQWIELAHKFVSSEEFLNEYEFLNGTPCGKLKNN